MRADLLAGLRMAFFLGARSDSFQGGAGRFGALVALNLLLNLVWSLIFVGPEGGFNLQAVPSAVFGALTMLCAGALIARVLQDSQYTLRIPVAVASIGITVGVLANFFWFAVDREWLPLPQALGPYFSYFVVFGWWSAVTLLAVARLVPWVPRVGLLPVVIFVLVVVVPTYFLPSGRLWEVSMEEGADTEAASRWNAVVTEQALYAQPELLAAELASLQPERPGIDDLYFVGFAPYAAQDVFMKEMLAIEKMLEERFDVAGRSLSLISHPSLVNQVPLASLTSLRRALKAVGERINPEEDIVLLHITTHGSENHKLSVEFWPLKLESIGPAALRAALDDSGIKWRVVVVSACYAGGFIEALKDPHTLVVAAADARSQSFGCGNQFDYTYFSKAFFDEALRTTHSFPDAYNMARDAVLTREKREKIAPSRPQIFEGNAMREKLAKLRARLDAAVPQ